MNPSTSNSEVPKPITSPRRTLPEAPPSYYDFPPSYTSSNDINSEELPAYCPREIPISGQQYVQDSQRTQRVYSVLPRQAYAIRMQRARRVQATNNHIRRRLNMIIGSFFVLLLATIIFVLTILQWPISPEKTSKMHNSKEDLDRFYSDSRRTSSITVPPHGIIPAVYSIETGVYNPDCPEEQSGISKTVKIAFVLAVLTVLLVGFVFAILSVTRITKA